MTISTAARQLTFSSYSLENALSAYLRCLVRLGARRRARRLVTEMVVLPLLSVFMLMLLFSSGGLGVVGRCALGGGS
jgi:hypothetical protein